VLGLLLRQVPKRVIHGQVLADAEQEGGNVSQLVIRPILQASDLTRGLNDERVAMIDQALAPSLKENPFLQVKIWNRSVQVGVRASGRRFLRTVTACRKRRQLPERSLPPLPHIRG
jgi:hypothetical protein